MPQSTFKLTLPVSQQQLHDWHAAEGAFQRLAPPWQRMEIVKPSGGIDDGSRLVFRIHLGPFSLLWEALHSEHRDPEQFVDTQLRGPFARWRHVHRFEEADGASRLVDELDWALPLEPLSRWLVGGFARRELDRLFAFRQHRLEVDLMRHATAGDARWRVAVAGSSGLVGQRLCAMLSTGGHEVLRLVRREARAPDEISWDPAAGRLDPAALEGLTAVVNLAGPPISQRWSSKAKQDILEARVGVTDLLARTLAQLDAPGAFISASAVGYYGDGGETLLTEQSPPGKGFLAEVCQAWERAADPAREAGVRVVHPRIGIVLEPGGALLGSLVPIFSKGLGGPMGNGKQWVPWITADDLLGVLHHAILEPLEGPVAAVSPNPVRQRELARTLGRVLRRPAFLPTPAAAVRGLFGQMGEELMLYGQRVQPTVLEQTGFSWSHPELEPALRHLLGR